MTRPTGEAARKPGGEPAPTEIEIAAAYAQDRSEQYTDKSSAKCALEDLASDLRNGEHMTAYEHGELDDLIAWRRKAVAKRGKR